MDDTAAHGVGRARTVTRFAPLTPTDVADLLLGLASVGAEAAGRVVDRARPPVLLTAVAGVVTSSVTSTLSRLGDRVWSADRTQDVLRVGRSRRRELGLRAEEAERRVAAAVVEAVLDLVDLTDVVLDHVDLDAVVRAVDLDQAVERVDIGAILDRVDVDAVVARADLDRAVARVDIQAILDRVDVDAIAQRLDLDAVVARLDLVALAEFVVEGIDLPGIIQSSSGAMASESIREVRWQGVSADERVAHVVDRMLRRRPRTPRPALPGTELPGGPVIPGTTV